MTLLKQTLTTRKKNLMNTLKTGKNKTDNKEQPYDTILASIGFFMFSLVVTVPACMILAFAALFFGLPWTWFGGGLIMFSIFCLGLLVSGFIHIARSDLK